MGALEDTNEQLTELKKLREAHRRRLSVLQVQAAQSGYETPPAITTEMEDIDRQLTGINQKISLLAGALPAQLEQLGPVDPQSLIPQTIVPATINERLLMLTLEVMHLADEMRKNFGAVHQSQAKDTESLWHALTDTRDQIAMEREERLDWQEKERIDREDWQDEERASRRYKHKIHARWLWIIGSALVLLFLMMAVYVATEYVRDLLIAQTGR